MKPRAITRELRNIRRSFTAIQRALTRLALAAAASQRQPAADRKRRALTLTPALRASLKLKGQYMGYVRNLRPRQKSRVKALKATKGYPAAIRLARELAQR
jgi:hypothetical protein